jgi:hypothetical protein
MTQTRFEQFLEEKKCTVDNPTTNLRQLHTASACNIFLFFLLNVKAL